jgi:hypothetical protein
MDLRQSRGPVEKRTGIDQWFDSPGSPKRIRQCSCYLANGVTGVREVGADLLWAERSSMNRRTSLAKDVSRKHVNTILVVTDDVGCAAHAVAGVAGKPLGG